MRAHLLVMELIYSQIRNSDEKSKPMNNSKLCEKCDLTWGYSSLVVELEN